MVLGPTGRNFAAGMSGGEVYVLDEDGELPAYLNEDGCRAVPLDAEPGAPLVRRLLENHVACTDSEAARRVLRDWAACSSRFVSVVPETYDRVVRESLSRGHDLRPPIPARLRNVHRTARAS